MVIRRVLGIGASCLFVMPSLTAAQQRGGGPALPRSEQHDAALNELAVAYALAGRDLPPIPLHTDRPELGVALLPIHRKVLAARAQLALGVLPDLPIETRSGSSSPGIVIVAYPVQCDDGRVRAREVALIGRTAPQQTGPVRVISEGYTEADLARLLPGLDIPEGTLATGFYNRVFTPDDTVVIRYGDPPCADPGEEVQSSIELQRPRQLLEVHAQDSTQTGTVRMRALIDVDGAPHAVAVVEGVPTLHYEALRLAAGWRFEPGRINGVEVPHAAGFRIRFGPGRP